MKKALILITILITLTACPCAPAITPEPEIWTLEVYNATTYLYPGGIVCRAVAFNYSGRQLHALRGTITFNLENAPSINHEFQDNDINFTNGSDRIVAYPREYTGAAQITGCTIRMVGTWRKQFKP